MLFSCKDDNESFIVDTALDISIKDNKGSDLLDPNNPNSLNENDIKIIYEIDGEQIEVNKPNLDVSRGFFIHKVGSEYRIAIHLNTDKNTQYPVTYIKWNDTDTDTDTLKCEIERKNGNYEVCKKVWLNGEVVWDDYGIERFIEIVK